MREGVLSKIDKGFTIVIPEKPSREIKLSDIFRVFIDSWRIKLAMLSPFPGHYPKAASISHCQIDGKDPLRFFVLDKWEIERGAGGGWNRKTQRHSSGGMKFGWYFGSRLLPVRTIINPEIIEHSAEAFQSREGCMSFPTKNLIAIRRYVWVKVRFWSFLGPRVRKLYYFRSALVQHELDHMGNMTIFERQRSKNKLPWKK